MKSKIRVEYDFDKKEPYIQMYLEKELEEQPDLRDQMLKHFVQSASQTPIWIYYPMTNVDNSCPQVRFMNEYQALCKMHDYCASLIIKGHETSCDSELLKKIGEVFDSLKGYVPATPVDYSMRVGNT